MEAYPMAYSEFSPNGQVSSETLLKDGSPPYGCYSLYRTLALTAIRENNLYQALALTATPPRGVS